MNNNFPHETASRVRNKVNRTKIQNLIRFVIDEGMKIGEAADSLRINYFTA
jgi:hypothetical protein